MNVLEKNLLVLASAGSGKTYTLSDRIIGLICKGAKPSDVVALTFTRKAAGEFADAILKKLAKAAANSDEAASLCKALGERNVDFPELLESVVAELPELTLGTMDGFFAKVVRGFQYELGISGGKFDLLEGEAADIAYEELLESFVVRQLDAKTEEEFIRTFRRATTGKEETKVAEQMGQFVKSWQQLYLADKSLEWGPASLAGVDVSEWEKQKGALISQVRRDWPNVPDKKKRHESAFEPMLNAFEQHTIGSGLLDKASGLVPKILEAAREGNGSLDISFYQPLTITGAAAEGLRSLVDLAARCELASALARTRGIYEVISSYDRLVQRELRDNGKLGFNDVKRLMGQWMKDEDARLRREAVDFRLDARYHHWLLDEFQDTSREEWDGLLPLLDEAITDSGSSLFVVGDKKQAIFAWRGGDIGLFDELQGNYHGGIVVESMAQSWRSSPEVLRLVNTVCGDSQTMIQLFGNAANQWQWQDHVSAPPLAQPGNAGYSHVEIVDKDLKKERVAETLGDLGIGRKDISCGILVETNDHVAEWADYLRNEGYQVVEEGAREPGKDHPVGVMIWQLLRWLADPSDRFAQQTVMMSPLSSVFLEKFGKSWETAWEQLGGLVSERGFAGMLEEIVAPLRAAWSDFGKRRVSDLLQALEKLDQEGISTAREAADRVSRMKISQSPGTAAVQVMTVHKSKGLGFDVVILPDIPSKKIPDLGHFEMIVGDGWVTDAPAAWARGMIPELREAETKWGDQQTYEAFCKLYVALTRAKRGLYVFLDEPPKSFDPGKPSLQGWLISSLGLDIEIGSVFSAGVAQWQENVGEIAPGNPPTSFDLGLSVSKRSRSTPSSKKAKDSIIVAGSEEGKRFGTAVHAAFEQIGWLDESKLPDFPGYIKDTMQSILSIQQVIDLLSKKLNSVKLYREQRLEAVIDGQWMSGIIDRLHVHLSDSGEPTLLEIIDFKTDRVDNAEALVERYSGQMETYRKAMKEIYPTAVIKCLLLSTALGEIIPVN
ncbi:UvrD-helicase domain-containing protein [Luteolibacter sp. AS25]|uniref:UvrD-helicase domain-containing protein n=1 Tax=Luteolibacter sp. AS25 TaxID=3135776 RepID=UPI00398AE0AF